MDTGTETLVDTNNEFLLPVSTGKNTSEQGMHNGKFVKCRISTGAFYALILRFLSIAVLASIS
jgi:hypothetical protein